MIGIHMHKKKQKKIRLTSKKIVFNYQYLVSTIPVDGLALPGILFADIILTVKSWIILLHAGLPFNRLTIACRCTVRY